VLWAFVYLGAISVQSLVPSLSAKFPESVTESPENDARWCIKMSSCYLVYSVFLGRWKAEINLSSA